MSREDALRWNARHAAADADPGPPSGWLVDHLSLLPPPPARVLDLACGRGRNALLLAGLGHDVTAVDVSAEGLRRAGEAARARNLPLRLIERDLEEEGLPPGTWDVILDFYYLARSLFPALPRALAPSGLLLVETFTVAQAERGAARRAFCLERGELRRAFEGLDVVDHAEDEATGIASLVARAPA